MFEKTFAFGGTLLVAAGLVFLTPGPSQAAPRGGGGGAHFGGAHFGGAHFGGARFGGARFGGAHVGGAHVGGARFGGYRGGYYGGGYGYGLPYASYYPSYGLYNNYPDYSDTYPYAGSSPTYDSGYYGSSEDVTPSYPDGYTSVTPPAASDQVFSTAAPADTKAYVTVSVPTGARLWFEGKLTTSKGPIRQFESPPLTPEGQYTYEIQASWNENGKEVNETQRVEVTAGAHVRVSFPVPAKTNG